jgi:hypothetical protein
VWKYLLDNGNYIISKILESIINVPPRDIVDNQIATLVAFCHNIPNAYKQQWFQSAFLRVPNNILTEEEKVN